MTDVVIRRFRPSEHAWGTKGHARGRCTECPERATVSVDWFGPSTWTASYCPEHLSGALERQAKRLGRPLEVDDRRL